MTLQYSAVGIQNESHMATSIDDYWKDLKDSRPASLILCGIVAWICLLNLSQSLKVELEAGALWRRKTSVYIMRLCLKYQERKQSFLACKQFNIFLIAQMVAKVPDLMPDRIFNVAFIIDPNGELIHTHIKTSFIKKKPTRLRVIFGMFILRNMVMIQRSFMMLYILSQKLKLAILEP